MSYSQNNEEEIILDYFGNLRGTFLDLGANDGSTLSNTRALALLGWRGVLVDASPSAYLKLLQLYKNSNFYLFNLALGKQNGPISFYESGNHLGENDIGLVSTLNQSEKKRFERSITYEKIEVDCMTWDSFYKICPLKSFDFISMDIEGSELDILPYIDLSQTSLICIEWNGKDYLKKEYEKYLSYFNLVHSNPENLIYENASLI